MHLRSSNGFTSQFRLDLLNHDILSAHDPYLMHLGRQLNFRNKADPTIAYIENERIDHDDY